MRLPITDKFLWVLYEFFEQTNAVLKSTEIFQLRSWRNIVPLGDEIWRVLEKKKRKKHFAQFINYLKKKGYIKIATLKEKRGILLTPNGRKKVLKVKFKLLNKKRRKDKKWIMVMYDIPERMRKERVSLREMLQILGFQKLQKSIWICPYDMLKETEEIIRIHSIDPYVKIFLIEEISI